MPTTPFRRFVYITGWGKEFLTELGQHYFKEPVDTIQTERTRSQGKIRHYFLDAANWNDVYSFIEFVCNCPSTKFYKGYRQNFIQMCNTALEKESSGYRIIDRIVTPITDAIEIAGIEEAVNSKYEFANRHLRSAQQLLSDRSNNPNKYQNSIQQSISAIESICRTLVPKTNTLGDALKKIDKQIHFQSQFKAGLEKLYVYTCNEDGIRHALMDDSKVSFDEAKFMLVACSAFVNYLTAKASVLND